MAELTKLTEEQAYLDPMSILRDAAEILDVLLEDREQVIGEECEVTRDLIKRVKGAIAAAPKQEG